MSWAAVRRPSRSAWRRQPARGSRWRARRLVAPPVAALAGEAAVGCAAAPDPPLGSLWRARFLKPRDGRIQGIASALQPLAALASALASALARRSADKSPRRASVRFRNAGSHSKAPDWTNATAAPPSCEHPRPRRAPFIDRRPPEGPPARTSRADVVGPGPRRDLSTSRRRTMPKSAVRSVRDRTGRRRQPLGVADGEPSCKERVASGP